MRVVFLTRRYWPVVGGVEKHIYELSRQLTIDGHEVHIIYATKSIPASSPAPAIHLHTIPDTHSKLAIWRSLFPYISLFFRADIIHCHDVFFWYLPFRFLMPFKHVYTTFHGYETTYPLRSGALFMRRLSKLLSTASINVGSFIEKWYGTPAQATIYGAINASTLKAHRSATARSKQTITFIGRMTDDIGAPAYIAALTQYTKPFRFFAYGDGPYRNKFTKLGKVMPVADDVPNILSDADTVFASSYLSIIAGLASGAHVIAYANNPLKLDYLSMTPFKQFITICTSIEDIRNALDIRLTTQQRSDQQTFARSLTWENIKDVYYAVWGTQKSR
jgi:glycosyltransferase involved in cell wall biosynthesis